MSLVRCKRDKLWGIWDRGWEVEKVDKVDKVDRVEKQGTGRKNTRKMVAGQAEYF